MKKAILLAVLQMLFGCSSQRPLMPAPDIYSLGIMQPWSDSLPLELKSTDANIFYATDRIPASREDGRLDYGTGRSYELAIGEAVVNIGGDMSWEELEAEARFEERPDKINLKIRSVSELYRPDDPLFYNLYRVGLAQDSERLQVLSDTAPEVQALLVERLAKSPKKEFLVFVHGVHNTFDDSLYTTAEMWHYLGREFVPISYAWPAGQSGLLRGYSYDRESSEYTVFHFKRLLEWLALLPEAEGIHIIAHSRGTDVVLTAIRELMMEALARGSTPRESLKLRNVILAAPDVNLDVAMQRNMREGSLWAAERWTMYTSPNDRAIGFAETLFGGSRLGKTNYAQMDEETRKVIDEVIADLAMSRAAVIKYEGKRGGVAGHTYFRTNPAVMSDLVLIMRYGYSPGIENGRPLEYNKGIFWNISDDYLRKLKDQE